MNALQFAIKLLSFLPLIAQGVHAVQQDLSAGGLTSKLQAAGDAYAYAAAGALQVVPSEHQDQAQKIIQIGSDILNATVTDLHNQAIAKRE